MAQKDETPEGGAYLALTASHGGPSNSLFTEPFFAIPLPDGGTMVADFGGHRLCVLSADGASVVPLGSRGRKPGEFTGPLGIALSSRGCLIAADDFDRVQLLDEDGCVVRCIPPPKSSASSSSSSSSSSTTFTAPGAAAPGAPALAAAPEPPIEAWLPHGGHAAIGELHGSRIQQGELSDPNPPPEPKHESFPIDPNEPVRPPPHGKLRQPYGVAIGPGDRLYVSDKGNDRIACFDSAGNYAFDFGGRGKGAGQLFDPRGVAVAAGQVWVADMCNHRVSVFSLRGRPLRRVGQFGDKPGEFRHPVGVALTADLLLVSEYSGGRIQVLTTSGVFLQQVSSPFEGACLCALGADARRVTVTDTKSRLHCFQLRRRGPQPAEEPPPAKEEEEGGALALARARNFEEEEEQRVAELRRTREGRIKLAMEASDYRGVLHALTQDDMTALMPQALKHAAEHPELYVLPPCRSADEIEREYEQHLQGIAPPLGPPH